MNFSLQILCNLYLISLLSYYPTSRAINFIRNFHSSDAWFLNNINNMGMGISILLYFFFILVSFSLDHLSSLILNFIYINYYFFILKIWGSFLMAVNFTVRLLYSFTFGISYFYFSAFIILFNILRLWNCHSNFLMCVLFMIFMSMMIDVILDFSFINILFNNISIIIVVCISLSRYFLAFFLNNFFYVIMGSFVSCFITFLNFNKFFIFLGYNLFLCFSNFFCVGFLFD